MPKSFSGFAVFALVFAIAGLFFGPFGIIAIALGRTAIIQIAKNKEMSMKSLSKIMAIIAMILGTIEVILLTLDFIFGKGVFKGLEDIKKEIFSLFKGDLGQMFKNASNLNNFTE